MNADFAPTPLRGAQAVPNPALAGSEELLGNWGVVGGFAAHHTPISPFSPFPRK